MITCVCKMMFFLFSPPQLPWCLYEVWRTSLGHSDVHVTGSLLWLLISQLSRTLAWLLAAGAPPMSHCSLLRVSRRSVSLFDLSVFWKLMWHIGREQGRGERSYPRHLFLGKNDAFYTFFWALILAGFTQMWSHTVIYLEVINGGSVTLYVFWKYVGMFFNILTNEGHSCFLVSRDWGWEVLCDLAICAMVLCK